MKKLSLIASSLLFGAVLAVSATAPAAGYFLVSAEGQKTGKFKGESTAKGEEDKIPAVAFSYSVRSPRDPSSGLATGKRQHSPITITKAWGASSPQFFQSLVQNETLKTVEFTFTTVDLDGKPKVYQTIKLANAVVVGMTRRSSVKNANATTDLDDISFSFQSIEITDTSGTGAVTASDNIGNVNQASF